MRCANELVVVALVALAEVVSFLAHGSNLKAERDDFLPDPIQIGLQVRDAAQDVVALVLESALLRVLGMGLFAQLANLGHVPFELLTECRVVGTRCGQVGNHLRGMLEEESVPVSRPG